MSKGDAAYWLFICALYAFLFGNCFGERDADNEWRTWQCAQADAALVADTLCIRSDTVFRVPEPGRGTK